MKRLCQSSADRIANLPADLIQRILVCLPIKDAAKTSLLSRNWRHRWRSIPQLVFGDDFSDTIDELESECKVMSKQVMLTISQCLLHHDGPITKFVLSIPGLCTCLEMDLIIFYLSNKGVQHFTFKLIHLNYDDEDIDFYQMHSSLFSALQLKSLTLGYCVLTPPSWFDGFRKLTHLGLDSVKLPSDFFENFLPKCPMLESLSLFCIYCEVLDGKLEIVAPLLKSFSCVGSFLDVCFKSTPLLSDVELDLNDGGKPDSDMVSLFASLPALHKFYSWSVGNMLKGELDLVRFVLATAPLLRLIHIRPWFELRIEKVMEFRKEVIQYKRVSKDAEVIVDSKFE